MTRIVFLTLVMLMVNIALTYFTANYVFSQQKEILKSEILSEVNFHMQEHFDETWTLIKNEELKVDDEVSKPKKKPSMWSKVKGWWKSIDF